MIYPRLVSKGLFYLFSLACVLPALGQTVNQATEFKRAELPREIYSLVEGRPLVILKSAVELAREILSKATSHQQIVKNIEYLRKLKNAALAEHSKQTVQQHASAEARKATATNVRDLAVFLVATELLERHAAGRIDITALARDLQSANRSTAQAILRDITAPE